MVEWRVNRAYLDDKKIGWIDILENIFISPRKESHKFRKYNSWGFSKDLLEDLEKKAVNKIEIKLPTRSLNIDLNLILAKGEPYKHPNYEEQLLVEERFFTESIDSKQQTLFKR